MISKYVIVYREYEEIKHHQNLPWQFIQKRLRKEIKKLFYWYICDLTHCNAVKNSKQVLPLSLSKLAPVNCRKPPDSMHETWNWSCQFEITQALHWKKFHEGSFEQPYKTATWFFLSDFFLHISSMNVYGSSFMELSFFIFFLQHNQFNFN